MNDPSKLIFLIPSGLADGEYTLQVTTQYSGAGKVVLKKPRTLLHTIYLGKAPDGGGDEGEAPDPNL